MGAYALQAAKVQARIKEEEMQVKVVERQQNIAIQEQEIMRKEKELDSKIRKPAEAEKFKLEKLAEAERLKIVLEAEANAFKEYREAAMVDMMLKVLPQVAAEISGPISQANKITMVATGEGQIGAGKMTEEVLDIMGSLPDTVKKMPGVDISAKMITVQD